jgi:two-component system cell cycle response regulator
MREWPGEFLLAVLDAAPDGIVLTEARLIDQPVVYANAAFERITGYSSEELLGQDLRRLQGSDREQEGRAQLREAIDRGEGCCAVLRNYRKDGTPFWNEVLLRPMRGNDGLVTHFMGFHRDSGEPEGSGPRRAHAPTWPREDEGERSGLRRVRGPIWLREDERARSGIRRAPATAGSREDERERSGLRRAPGLPSWLREDRLTGLCSRAYFEELLQHDWQIGMREARPLTLLIFDIDELGVYNDTFGRAAGDACIRRVAGLVGGAFQRGADVVARWEGGRIVALVRNSELTALPAFAASVARKILDHTMHHPRATRQKFVTVSVGVASVSPTEQRSSESLEQAALRALLRAKQERAGPVAIATPEELLSE